MEEAHTNNGGYDAEGVIWHQHSNKLMLKILELFPKEVPVLDVGCGHNFYISVLNYLGYKAEGCDLVDLGSKYFFKADVTDLIPYSTKHRKTNVISLEVGEHLPFSICSGYIDNLCNSGGDIIMSWAIPGQAGLGHINCQPNDWVINEMAKRKYLCDFDKTERLRNAVSDCHCKWFKNTLMYFTPCV